MTPPRLAEWLLQRAVDPVAAEAVAGDLLEEYRRRAADDGLRRARRWYWRQALGSIAAHWRDGIRAGLGAIVTSIRKGTFMTGLVQDLRLGIRTLQRAPLFSLAALLTLALGIGAATAIATAAHRTLLRPLPYPHGDRLVKLGHPDDLTPGGIGNVGFATVVDWRARLKTFDALAIVRGWQPTLTDAAGAERLDGLKVNWNFFRMLGVTPALGRDFREDEDHPDRWRVVILSDSLWRRRFAARPDIAGSTIEFNGRRYEVAGVLPASFDPLIAQHFATSAEVWAPLGYALGGDSSCRTCQHLKLVGRLSPGATLDAARAELATVHAGLRLEHPTDYSAAPPVAESLRDVISSPVRRPLQIVVGAAMFLLLVACANVAGLLLARATDRERELVVRAALGAGRGRLVRQLLAESCVLAILATALGVLLAHVGLRVLARLAPVTVPGLDGATGDPILLLMAAALATISTVLFGLLPAWTASRPDLQAVLRAQRQSSSRGSLRVREVIMTVEMAAAVLLVAGAGLMVRTVDRLLHVNPGFDPRGVLTMNLSLVGQAWAEDSAVRTFQQELLTRVSHLPSVTNAALAGQVPLGHNYDRWGFRIEGREYPNEDAPSVERYAVTPGYFDVMRIPLRGGRLLNADDRTDGPLVMVVGETTARTLWPSGSPIGQRVRIGGPDGPWREVVGIVGDVRHYGLGEPPTTQMYTPQSQMTDSFLTLVVRTPSDPASLVDAVRREVASLARDVPTYAVATFDQLVSDSVGERRFLMQLLGVFALSTLALAAVGLYGLVSQAVASRRREFGIRLALGASRPDIFRLVLGRGVRLLVISLAAGLIAAGVVGRLLASQLYDTAPGDPLVMILAVATLVAVVLGAHVPPLRRATRVNPVITLMNE